MLYKLYSCGTVWVELYAIKYRLKKQIYHDKIYSYTCNLVHKFMKLQFGETKEKNDEIKGEYEKYVLWKMRRKN